MSDHPLRGLRGFNPKTAGTLMAPLPGGGAVPVPMMASAKRLSEEGRYLFDGDGEVEWSPEEGSVTVWFDVIADMGEFRRATGGAGARYYQTTHAWNVDLATATWRTSGDLFGTKSREGISGVWRQRLVREGVFRGEPDTSESMRLVWNLTDTWLCGDEGRAVMSRILRAYAAAPDPHERFTDRTRAALKTYGPALCFRPGKSAAEQAEDQAKQERADQQARAAGPALLAALRAMLDAPGGAAAQQARAAIRQATGVEDKP